jgi:hypothetical protein
MPVYGLAGVCRFLAFTTALAATAVRAAAASAEGSGTLGGGRRQDHDSRWHGDMRLDSRFRTRTATSLGAREVSFVRAICKTEQFYLAGASAEIELSGGGDASACRAPAPVAVGGDAREALAAFWALHPWQKFASAVDVMFVLRRVGRRPLEGRLCLQLGFSEVPGRLSSLNCHAYDCTD